MTLHELIEVPLRSLANHVSVTLDNEYRGKIHIQFPNLWASVT